MVRVLRAVSTVDWQDPASSLVRQREQAGALVRGHGTIVAEFFDIEEAAARRGPVARRPLLWSPNWLTRIAAGARS